MRTRVASKVGKYTSTDWTYFGRNPVGGNELHSMGALLVGRGFRDSYDRNITLTRLSTVAGPDAWLDR